LSDQKKQTKSTDSKVIIGDVKKSLKSHQKSENLQRLSTTTLNNGITTSEVKKTDKYHFWDKWSTKKRLLTIIICGGAAILFIFLAAYVAITFFSNKKSNFPLINDLSPAQVVSMSDEQATEISKLDINPRKDPKAAYIQAMAFSQIGNNDKAYKIMGNLASLGYGDYNFYLNYALIASRVGNNSIAIKETKHAISMVNSDNKIDKFTKDDILNKLNSKLSGFEDTDQ
jgi:multidrug efflux pump subunit AcrB